MSESKGLKTGHVVLVTGVAGYWGSQVADRLVTETDYHVIGLDADRPVNGTQGLDFIQVDVRNPALVDLLRAEAVDTVCHLAFLETLQPSEVAFDLNVMGTTKVVAACAEAGVRKVILKSSTAVYGARPSNSAFLTEEHGHRGSRRTGYTRDLMQVEAFCRGFSRQVPEMLMTILRFASVIGPTADTPMNRFLHDPWAPSLLGFDPLMQFIHEDDVVEALVYAVVQDAPGAYNVAAEDVLPLNKVRGLAGKPRWAVLHPIAYWGKSLPIRRRLGLERHLPLDPDYLRYSCVADLTKMREELDFQPRYTAEEALREFAKQKSLRDYLSQPAVLGQSEERLRAIIDQRQRGREWRSANRAGDILPRNAGNNRENGSGNEAPSETHGASIGEQGGDDE